jgi:hypothetical protein
MEEMEEEEPTEEPTIPKGGATFPTDLNKKKNKEFLQPYWDKVPAGIKAAAASLDLTLAKKAIPKCFVFQGIKSSRLGSRPIEPLTKSNNEIVFRTLWSFCSMIGDYESMLMLLVRPPTNVPAMRVETIDLFLRFKRQSTNSPLLFEDDETEALDIFGTPVLAEG